MIYLYLAIGAAIQFIYLGALCISLRNEPGDLFDCVRKTVLERYFSKDAILMKSDIALGLGLMIDILIWPIKILFIVVFGIMYICHRKK